MGGVTMPRNTEGFMEEYILGHDGISVGCGFPEEKRVAISYRDCDDVKDIEVQDVLLKFTSRMVKVSVDLRMICTGKKVALGVILEEKEDADFITRGIRICEIDVPGKQKCQLTDLLVDDFCFHLPDWSPCVPRTFRVCIVAHYIN